MKKIIIILMVLFIGLSCFTSCAGQKKIWSQHATYKDPQTLGGYWNITLQTGQTFIHVKCTYWGTDDDTAVFELDDGTIICQSGAVVCVRAR